VRLVDHRPEGAAVERADPDQALERGLDAEVDAPIMELGAATPGDSFVDLAPLHVITTATLQSGTHESHFRVINDIWMTFKSGR
jgi:uncharacterized protein